MLSVLRGAAGGARPEEAVSTHEPGEDRAASGVRRLRATGRARVLGAAGRRIEIR